MNIDPISAASPDMDDDDMKLLCGSIQKHGQLVPIVTWKGRVVDGRKRLACCEAIGIEPITIMLPDEADVTSQALDLNLLRTHYTASQRAMYAATLATLKKGDVAAQRVKGGDRIRSPLSSRAAARQLAVSNSQVILAKKVRRDAAPEVVRAVERGELTLHAAGEIASAVPLDEQAEATRTVSAAGGQRKNVRKVLHLGGGTVRRQPVRLAADAKREGCVTSLDQITRALRGVADEPCNSKDAGEWLATIHEAIRELKRFTLLLEKTRAKHQRSATA